MNTITTNISMPKGLYEKAKRQAKKYHYSSVSEVIRDALRWWMNDKLTRNGFTPEFEEETLRSAKLPMENDVEWDGVTPFTEFLLAHPPKINGKSKIQYKLPSKIQKIGRTKPRNNRRDKQEIAVV